MLTETMDKTFSNEDVAQCIRIAENLQLFHDYEIDIIKRVLDDYQQDKDGYNIICERVDSKVIAFVIFGRIPLTIYGWDIYWMVVDKEHQGKGIGKKLIRQVEEQIIRDREYANLRVETSTRKEYAHARNLYNKAGFYEVGRIADFYDQGDDIVIFYKRIVSG